MSAVRQTMRAKAYFSVLGAFLEGEVSLLGVSDLLSEVADEAAPLPPEALELGPFRA